jgi:ribose transport system permease protein
VVVAALCGTLTGLVSVHWRIPSFIVSLGVLEIARGLAYQVTNSRTEYIGSAVDVISSPVLFGMSPAFLSAIAIVIIAQLVLTRTVLGRYWIGIGTNEEAVRLSGVNPNPSKILAFALMGALAGIAALFQVSRLEAADPNGGVGMELQVIAAVVIGGTSLMGGRGSIVSTFIGVLIISVLEAGLAQVGVSEPMKRIITGAVIVVAVISTPTAAAANATRAERRRHGHHQGCRQAGRGVYTTVSHVLNQTRPVSDARERVLAAVKELDYVPSALARSLRSKVTGSIGLIIPNNTNPYFSELARGIEDHC